MLPPFKEIDLVFPYECKAEVPYSVAPTPVLYSIEPLFITKVPLSRNTPEPLLPRL